MNILVPKLSGFCPGVKNAEKKILSLLFSQPNENYAVLGMMINNRDYIKYLESKGVQTIQNIDNVIDGSIIFLRTHGVNKELQKNIEQNFKVIDLTCKNVKRVQNIIQEHSQKNAMVFITGKKNHPEILGLKSYAKQVVVFETEEDINYFLKNPLIKDKIFFPKNYSEIFITSQTTGNKRLFLTCIEKIKKKWPNTKIFSFNSICPVTEKKEQEAITLQNKADVSFVIGDTLSSNANKLFKILKKNNDNTFFIQGLDCLKKLDVDFSDKKTALVVSSASTPHFIENKVVTFLAQK